MMHYYFYKYWSRVLVGSMVSLVVITFGLFTFSLTATHKTGIENAESANGQNIQAQAYQKSATLFTKIQELKVKKQDTTQLEALYSDSVKNLSNQHEDVAVTQLNQLESQIAKINESLILTPSPAPSVIASTSGTVTPPATPSVPSVEGAAFESSSSADTN